MPEKKNALWIFFLIAGIVAGLFSSCQKDKGDSGFVRINKVLILGNSITQHDPDASLGWYGNWGMAASSVKNDYVHLLIGKCRNYNKQVVLEYGNIALSFEKRFWTFDTLGFKSYKDFGADLIIIRLGENVNDSYANQYGFDAYLFELINYLRKDTGVVVCCTGSFWPNVYIDAQIENLSLHEGYIFVPLSDLYKDKKNTAMDGFENTIVGAHPSDKGMENIANRIWAKISFCFTHSPNP